MNKAPFFIGIVVVVPLNSSPVWVRDKELGRQLNGHGVGTLLYTNQAILHEAIKDDMCREAVVYWVEEASRYADPVSRLGIETILRNTSYVSIEDVWYRILSSEQAKLGCGCVADGVKDAVRYALPPQGRPRILVTLFGEESGILNAADEAGSPDMAIVVERYAATFSMFSSVSNPVQPLTLSAIL